MSKRIYLFTKYLCFFALLYILMHAQIGELNDFAFGMYFCLIWCGQSMLILSPIYLLSAFLQSFDVNALIYAGATVGVVLLFYFLHYKFKKPFNTLLLMMYGFLSQVVYMYMHAGVASEFFASVLSVGVGLVFLYCCLHFFQNVLLRGVRRKFFIDEGICAGVILAVFAAGLYNVPYGAYISICFSVVMMLVILWSYGVSGAILCSTLLGLGMALTTQNPLFIVRMVLLSIAAGAMKTNNRLFAVLAVILIDVFVELYLMPIYSIINIASVSVGAILFVLIPKRWLLELGSFVITEGQNNALYEMLERQRKELQQKLGTLSNVFFEMKNTYLGMVKRNYTTQDVYDSVNTQITQSVCSQCPNKDNCLTINMQETAYHINELSKLAYTRGRVSLSEVAPNFARRCVRLPVVVNALNHNIAEYKHTMFDTQSNNEYKLMMAEQLYGVSNIFKTLSTQMSQTIVFDKDNEELIIENLAKNQILCTECLVYNEEKDNIKVSLNIRKKDLINSRIEHVVSQCLNTPMQVHSTMHSTTKNNIIVLLKGKNIYDVIFGCAGISKHGNSVSGDTYSVTRVNHNQILMSICDGMGSGENAESISKRSISLIENFYKAGFDSHITLKIVNNLLSQRGEDNFSAIDIGIINLHTGILDLYKVGAPCSFVKKATETITLNSGALPLGIIKDAKPHIQSVVLDEGDYVILVSDGISDCIRDNAKMCEIINGIENTNPQAFANDLLSIILKSCNNLPLDDMTVVVGRLIKN